MRSGWGQLPATCDDPARRDDAARNPDDFIELLQKQVGLSSEVATKFGPAVIVFVAQRGDEDAGELLVGALGL